MTKTRICRWTLRLFLSILASLGTAVGAERDESGMRAELEARERVPDGGNFAPDPQEPVVVALGKGGRILFSGDDGASWRQVFFGAPTTSHGYWVTRSLAYTGGMFATTIGWGKPPMVLASDDGVNWRHLAPPLSEQEGETKVDPMDMPGAWTMAGDERSGQR